MIEMNPEKIKFCTKEGMIAKLERCDREHSETIKTIIQFLSNAPISPLDVKADQAYEMIKQKGTFTSYDASTLGVTQKYRREKLFSKICDRHSDVRIKPARSPKDNRLIKVAYLLDDKIKEYETDPDEKYRKFFEDYTSKARFAEKLGLEKEDERVQKLISRLIREKKLEPHPVKHAFRWCGK
jgi:hypothetical protein